MEYSSLGNTGLSVSRLALGCEPLGGTDWGQVNVAAAMSAVTRALELGITVFDTADVYGLGLSEQRLAQALGPRRHDVVIVSKFGVAWDRPTEGGRARTYRDASPGRVKVALEESLRRLGIDSIPLYLIHWPDPQTPIGATMEALAQMKDQGKIQHLGVSNLDQKQIHEARQHGPLAAIEVQYSLLERGEESGILPYAQKHGLGVLAYGVLAQGMLTGKYGPDSEFDERDRRHRLPHFTGQGRVQAMKTVDRLIDVAARTGVKPGPAAIRWVLDNPAVHCAIVGGKTPTQVEEDVGTIGWQMPREERRYLEAETA
jgi:aryl-alcohol dehydrogenase-like predicted oxidoreductase